MRDGPPSLRARLGADRYRCSDYETSMSCFVLLFGDEEQDGSAAWPSPPRGCWGEQGKERKGIEMLCTGLYPCSGLPSTPVFCSVVAKEISTFQLGILGHGLPLKHLNK